MAPWPKTEVTVAQPVLPKGAQPKCVACDKAIGDARYRNKQWHASCHRLFRKLYGRYYQYYYSKQDEFRKGWGLPTQVIDHVRDIALLDVRYEQGVADRPSGGPSPDLLEAQHYNPWRSERSYLVEWEDDPTKDGLDYNAWMVRRYGRTYDGPYPLVGQSA